MRKLKLKKRKKNETDYNIQKLIEKYIVLEQRVTALEKGNQKATHSSHWDKTNCQGMKTNGKFKKPLRN